MALCEMTELEFAYLAGLTDGEGYIGITKTSRKHRNGRFSYQAHISIGMTDHDVLIYLRERTDLGFLYYKPQRQKKHKIALCWWLTAEPCRMLLPKILPYLRVKNKQAEIVLAYLSIAGHVFRKNPVKVAEYMDKCEAMFVECTKLNKRGVEDIQEHEGSLIE